MSPSEQGWTARSDSHDGSDASTAWLGSAWLWGPLLTVGLYLSLPHWPVDAATLDRWFRGHWTQALELGLFLVGAVALGQRLLALGRERQALRLPLIESAGLDQAVSSADRSARVWQSAAILPAALRGTQLVATIRAASRHVARRGDGRELEQHLARLIELAEESSRSAAAPVRALVGALPVMGLLGTALSAAALSASADGAILAGRLGAALDPLALALALTAGLGLAARLVEQQERQTRTRLAEFSFGALAPALAGSAPPAGPLAAAENKAAELLLQRSESLIHWQTGLWQKALEDLRLRWIESAESQQAQLAAALQQGTTASLSAHHQQLAESRGELLSASRLAAQELARVVAAVQQSAAAQQQQVLERIDAVWLRVQQGIAEARQEHAALTGQGAERLAEAIAGWQTGLQQATAAMTGQLAELRRQGELLGEIAGQEAELTRLQGALASNLQAVRGVGAFEESIHSLNAAIHLLTTRARPQAA